jgi:protein involved in polysaccharide export with SLBB domain
MRLSHLLLLPALLTGCLSLRTRSTAPELATPEQAAASPQSHSLASTLGGGDVLEVRVFQEQDLSGLFRVSPDGTIDYPLCGKVRLSGMTSSQAADALTTCLKAGYLRRPQVSVLVKEFNSKKVFVFGEVQKPGTFPFEEDMSIVQAVTLAGGFTKLAAQNGTIVTRNVDGQETKIRVPVADIATGQAKNFQLLPGDIVLVPESFF